VGLDTTYRPARYADVLGQDATIRILKRFISTGKGWAQGYLFAGPWGSGKTTLARLMARAMLCEAPTPDGEPCDACFSCTSLLTTGSSLDFTEVDAATNSGKESIQRIVEEIQYNSFSGRRHLYLFDEAHRLTPQALDAMLKPMEEGKLICLFATTEPEGMAETVFSRCAPAFVIQPVTPEKIAERLAWVCEKEGIEADREMLVTIAEMKECHIRDCLKAVEGISMLGAISKENVVSYLHLDQSDGFLDVLESIGVDFPKSITAVKGLLKSLSPVTCYEKLADLAMLAYQNNLGSMKAPAHMDAARLAALGAQHGSALLTIASRFASRPGYPNEAMLLCDIGALHHGGNLVLPVAAALVAPTLPAAVPTATVPSPARPAPAVPAPPLPQAVKPGGQDGKVRAGVGSAEVKPMPGAINDGRPRGGPITPVSGEMPVSEFARLLGQAVREEMRTLGGSSR
jgi:DNA polymerase III subunit gamma/tau